MTEFLATSKSGEALLAQAVDAVGHMTDDYIGNPDVQASIINEYLEEMYGTYSAAERIAPFVIRTPLESAGNLSAQTGNRVYLKREDQQPVKSFKIRGAASRMTLLTEEEKASGVIAVSAGNHAQGVALMARELGIPATIYMPETTPDIKVSAVKAYGATVEKFGDNYSECYEAFAASPQANYKTYIHAFDDKHVRNGNGTIGLEILADAPDTSHVFVPIGGGGLISGVAKAIKASRPDIRVIGVQYDQSDAMARSVEAGKLVKLDTIGIFSGGTAVTEVSSATLADTMQYVDEIITVSEDETVLAINDFYNETRSLLEPAGALSIAGVKKYSQETKSIGAMVAITSGANVDPKAIGPLLERAALLQGRRALVSIRLPERAGALEQLCDDVIAKHDIRLFQYAYNGSKQADILIELGLNEREDKEKVLAQLAEKGYLYADHSLSQLEREHAQHFVGGPSKLRAKKEAQFEVSLPSKSGALLKLLRTIGRDKWSISRFSYQNSGTEEEKVLIGFKVKNNRDRQTLTDAIAQSEYGKDLITVTGFEMQQFIGTQVVERTIA